MVHTKKNVFLAVLGLCVIFFGFIFVANFVYAVDDGSFGLNQTAQAAGLDKYKKDIPTIVGNIAGAGLSFASVIFFALMIYGGIRWMISRGNDEEAKKALNTIIAAIIGILIVVSSYALTTFVFDSFNGGGGGGGGGTGDVCCIITYSEPGTEGAREAVLSSGTCDAACNGKTDCSVESQTDAANGECSLESIGEGSGTPGEGTAPDDTVYDCVYSGSLNQYCDQREGETPTQCEQSQEENCYCAQATGEVCTDCESVGKRDCPHASSSACSSHRDLDGNPDCSWEPV